MSLPDLMQSVEITVPGGPEVLQICLRPLPQPGPGEVLIRVHAAGVNRPDIMQRRGLYPPPPGASDIPGLEVSGEIFALGEGVETIKIGDHVCALLTGGAYAEYCTASAALCLPVPDGLSMIEAAGLPEALFTVWANLVDTGQLQSGERFLVHGGSSGIGTMAIQLARSLGAEVYTTAGSVAKCRFCEALGATAINYREQDFGDAIKALTHDQGVHLILDMVGGPYLSRNLEALTLGGTLLVIAAQGGSKAELDLLRIFLKRLTISGSTLRSRSLLEKARLATALTQTVWPLLKSRQIRSMVDSTFPLNKAGDAHRHMETSQHMGKIILTTL